jgi:hypothetical protein
MFFGLLKSEKEARDWCYEAKDFLSFVGQGMSEREARDRARISSEELRQWKRMPGFRDAIRQARRNRGGLTAQGICSLAQLAPPETDEQAGERERLERAQLAPPGDIFGPLYGAGGGRGIV